MICFIHDQNTGVDMLMSLVFACGSSNLEKQPVPEELIQKWVSLEEYASKEIEITNESISEGDNSFELMGFEAGEANTWTAQLKYTYFGEENTEIAKLKLDSEQGLTIERGEGVSEYGKTHDLYGDFVNKNTVLIPEKYHGTWTSCDPLKCERSKLIVSADKIGLSTTGCEYPVTDEATLKYATTKVDKLHVTHSGLNSSGWDFYLVEDGDNIVISDAGEDYMTGTFRKGDQKCSAKDLKAKAKRVNTKKCQAYVDCICDLGENIGSSSSYGSNIYAGQCKQANRYLSAANGKACDKALDSFKDALESVEDMYEMVGIDIPYSCQ
mgnify:CR=1 FL=1